LRGDRPHIGSVSVGYLPFSDEERERGRRGVVLGTMSLPGHKDYVVSEMGWRGLRGFWEGLLLCLRIFV